MCDQLLEQSKPIYPFLHPVLIPASEPSDAPFARQGADSAKWQLPSVNQVRAWQKDRDALEEEVFDFDGGDLARIKEKTRGLC